MTWQAPGLNHNIWLTHFIYEGKDAYPLIDEWIATKGEEYWRTHVAERTHDAQMSRGAVHQYHMYGLLPIGDTVRHRRGGGITPTSTPRSAGSASRGAARTRTWRDRSSCEAGRAHRGDTRAGPNDPKADLAQAGGHTRRPTSSRCRSWTG